MKVRSASESGDSDDIDLDEILKTIDPLDDIDKRLFSADPASSPPRITPISSKQKDPVDKGILKAKDDDDAEVLTSLSSNNDQGKSESVGQSLSKNLGNYGVGATFNAPARARRRNAKFGAGTGDNTSLAMVGSSLPSSNIETGLWSGDDLWKLNEGKESNQPKASFMPSSKSLIEGYKLETVSKKISSSEAKGDKKPGKYDWLGLLDDESEEEKGESVGKRDQKLSTSVKVSVGKELKSHGRLESENLSLSGIDNDPSKVWKGSSRKSVEAGTSVNVSKTIDSQGTSAKNSLSENLGLPKSNSRSSESKSRRSGMAAKDEAKSAQSTVTFKDDDTASQGQSKEVKAKTLGTVNENIMGKEDQSKGTAIPLNRSLLEEEEKSPRSYTPSFLDGSPVKLGRRRRNREGFEGIPSRATINPDFDPLDLFSVDDAPSKTEDVSKGKKELPDWLTGSSKNMSPSKVNKDLMDSPREGVVKDEEMNKNVESVKNTTVEKSEEVSPYSPRLSAQKLPQPEEKPQDLTYNSKITTKVDPGKSLGKSQNETDVLSSTGYSQVYESEVESEKLSRSASDESSNKLPLQKSPRKSRKEVADYKTISEVDALAMEDKERSPIRRKVKKGDEKSSKKQHHKHLPAVEKIPKPKKSDLSGGRATNEEADSTSLSEKSDSKSEYSRQLASLERKYRRKVKEVDEKASLIEQLEEDLARMRFFEGEVEHLKALVHVLELEKSAVEAMVENLQARHLEQLKRLEDVHRNEVETLRNAVLREEKRGAEEVRRLVEDHKKTLDRLMDANVKLEEEFRTRMLEARRDWGRDVEAMRVAYQQSNNAAITNASLAVLTGHSFGSEAKEKGEDEAKGDSPVNTQSQCLQEVKELSQKVDRMETIMAQALELLMPKAKPQSVEVPVHEGVARVTEHGVVVNSLRKGRRVPVSTKGRHRRGRSMVLSKKAKTKVDKGRKLDEESGSSEEEEVSFEEPSHSVHSSDEGENDEEMVRSDTGFKFRRRTPKKDSAKKRKDGCCGECKCCLESNKDLVERSHRSMSAQDSRPQWNKSDKDGRNVNSRSRDGNEHWRNRRRKFSWKDQVSSENNFWNDKQDRLLHQPASSHVSMSESTGLDSNFISHLARSMNVIVDPKEYLMRLAATNANNPYQPSPFATNI